MRMAESHVKAIALNSRASILSCPPFALIPPDFLVKGRHDGLLFYRRAGPGAIPRRSRRERQDRHKSAWRHAKQPTATLEFKFYPCVTISLTPPPKAPFPRPLTTFTRILFHTAHPRGIIFDISDITS